MKNLRNLAHWLGWYRVMDLFDAHGERLKHALVVIVLLVVVFVGLWLIADLGHGG